MNKGLKDLLLPSLHYPHSTQQRGNGTFSRNALCSFHETSGKPTWKAIHFKAPYIFLVPKLSSLANAVTYPCEENAIVTKSNSKKRSFRYLAAFPEGRRLKTALRRSNDLNNETPVGALSICSSQGHLDSKL